MRFADGTILDVTRQDLALETYGLTSNETLYGYKVGDRIDGGTGADAVYGYGGADTLPGGDGNDACTAATATTFSMAGPGPITSKPAKETTACRAAGKTTRCNSARVITPLTCGWSVSAKICIWFSTA